jgi:hypothetical protein
MVMELRVHAGDLEVALETLTMLGQELNGHLQIVKTIY